MIIRKETYTREEVFEVLSDVAEVLTYNKDSDELVQDGLDRIRKIGKILE